MPLTRGLGAYDDGTPEAPGAGTNPIDVRKDLAGLFAGTLPDTRSVRAGLLPVPSTTVFVAGTSGWQYLVGPFHAVTSRGASDGVQLFSNDGPVNIGASGVGDTVPSAPSSGLSRIDIIWVRHPTNTENGDTSSQPVFGVAVGTPQAPPVPPTIPTGALELARNTVTSSATSTSSAGNTVTQTFPWAALRGTPIHVRNQAELDALTPYASVSDPIRAYRMDTAQDLVNYGAGWEGAWSGYTPAWTAATTNPSVGSGGALSGEHMRRGKRCRANIEMVIGSSGASGGSGAYSVSLPFASGSALRQAVCGWLISAGTRRTLTGIIEPGASTVTQIMTGTGASFDSSFALAGGAIILLNADYRIA